MGSHARTSHVRGWGTLPAHTTGRVLAFGLFLLLLLLSALCHPVEAPAVDVISQCLYPCHSSLGLMGPDVETAFMSAGENAGHATNWNSRVVESTMEAELPKGSRMPCTQCHIVHGSNTDSIYSFSSARADVETITSIRQLCTGCHRTYDALTMPPVVLGLQMKRLPGGVQDHGSASSTPCSDCHGLTGHNPEGHGGTNDCGNPVCHGGTGSHPIHLDAADPRGPGEMECTDCHEEDAFPKFASGTDSDDSGRIELDETDVCDTCHSPGGSYNGVEPEPAPSGEQSVGAKDNWVSHVYETTSTVSPGKERWCVGCHDGDSDVVGEEPSLIDGVYAPPVAGNEDEGYIYGTGWGFYETGHGLAASETIPSNGFDTGAGLECGDCHDYSQPHIDGESRSFVGTDTPDDYRTDYRLDLVDGDDPMLVPWPGGNVSNSADNYRLCTQSGCHDPYPFVNENASDRRTNFWKDAGYYSSVRDKWFYNMHTFHLGFLNQFRWSADWSGPNTSCINCVTCHNVHGSQYLGMIQDGSLISDTVTRTPGLKMWYLDDEVSAWEGNPTPPNPEDVTLAMSDGWIWSPGTAGNLCLGCHGGLNTSDKPRTLWQDYGLAPVLAWAGASGYEDDGVNPDGASTDGTVIFKINYADGNNDAPLYVTLLLDLNADGDFGDVGETMLMTAEIPGDSTYYNGNTYSITLTPAKAGDDQLDYRFEASDGVTGVSSSPTRTLTVENADPELLWTRDVGYFSDGVTPNSGTTAITDYEFRIAYRDGDGEGPVGGAPSLRIDKNDDGDYEDAGESILMTDLGDPSVESGKRYNQITTLTRMSDDTLTYYFEGSDGTTLTQSEVATVTVLQDINLAPSLDWTGEAEYADDGVNPDRQAATKPFTFRVTYTDANNDAPGVKQVWIDLDDDGVYEAGERFVMDDLVSADNPDMIDGDYSNGEIFAKTVNVPFPDAPGDGTLNYCFYYEDDNAAAAAGIQGTDRNLTVYTALYVPSEYATIQLAVMAANTSDTVLVDDGTYDGFAFHNRDITVESVNGPASTTIEESGGVAVNFDYYLSNPSDSTVSGFTIQNSNYGVFSNLSIANIENCIIDGNAIGVYAQNGARGPVTIDGCTISNSTDVGIRTANNTIDLRVYDTLFQDNSNTTNGSCLRESGGVSTFIGCIFDGNSTSGQGGALFFTSQADAHISDCEFTNNTSGAEGGAIYFWGNVDGTNAWIDRCVFAGNSAANGGAVYTGMGDYEITNCTFSGNLALGQGGGLYTAFIGHPTITNCTFSGNRAASGGGIYSTTSYELLQIHNCVLWSNESSETANDQIDGEYLTTVEVQYTDIAQTFTLFNNQIGNIHTDPYFVNPVAASNAPTSTGDYHLQGVSPCEGQASAAYSPTDDIDGDDRPQDSGYDIGSDEIRAPAADTSLSRRLSGWSRTINDSLPSLSDWSELGVTPLSRPEDELAMLVTLASQPADGEPSVPADSRTTSAPDTQPLAPAPSGSIPPAVPLAAGMASLIALGWKGVLHVLQR